MPATKTTGTVQVGSVVDYHGSITSEHWSTFYVSEIGADRRLTLIDRWYPTVTVLRRVGRANVTPTGEVLDLCACGHEAAFTLPSEPTICGACGWACTNHTKS